MTNKLIKFGVLSLLSSVSIWSTSLADGVEVGRNSAVKGTVEIQSLNETKKRQAIVKAPIFLGDNVNSRIGSSLQVLLRDSSTFTVGPQCDMVIDEFVYDPNKKSNSLSAKVKKGMFRFTSGKVSKTNPDQITIQTPTATMGIRGTMVEVLVGPEAFLCAEKEGLLVGDIQMDHAGATLVILRGPGENNTTVNRRGEVEVTSAGATTILTESGTGVLVTSANDTPSKPFVVSDALFNYFNRRLRTVPTRTGNFKPFKIEDSWFTPIPKEDETEFMTPLETIEESDWPSRDFEGVEPDFDTPFEPNIE